MVIGSSIKGEVWEKLWDFENEVECQVHYEDLDEELALHAYNHVTMFPLNRAANIRWECKNSTYDLVHKKAVSALGAKLPQPL